MVRAVAFLDGLLLGFVPLLSIFILLLNAISKQEVPSYFLVSKVLRYFPLTALAGVYGWLVIAGISVTILMSARRAWYGSNNAFPLLVAIVTLTRLLVFPFWVGLIDLEASLDTIARYSVNIVLVVVNVGGLIVVTLLEHDTN